MATAVDETRQEITRISETILAGNLQDSAVSLSLDEFAALYHEIGERVRGKQRIDIVLHDDRAIVQFTNLSPSNQRVYIVSDRRLTKEDFSRIVPNPVFHGDILEVSGRQRLEEELPNLILSSCIGLFFGVVLFLLGNSVAANYGSYLVNPDSFPLVERVVDFLAQINEMLLTSSTLFLSIFLVFTVAQSARLQEDTQLFDSGLLHKFERDDRLIALVALVSLLFTLLNIAILGIPVVLTVARWQITGAYTLTLNKISLVVPLITMASVVALTFCFLSLRYYLKRIMLITNRDMSKKVLNLAQKSVSHRQSERRRKP
jgi:hypothetical protein